MRLYPVRQRFNSHHIPDVGPAVADALEAPGGPEVQPGSRIAVAVGSRGIANISTIVRSTIDWLRTKGAEAFIVPAMGSHGGATGRGQRQVLEGYGITQASMGVPIRSSMETVRIGETDGLPLFMDRHAYESDGVVLVNRIKPHTDYSGFPESGLLKMSVIGLGNQDQANAVHSYGIDGLRSKLLPAAQAILATGKVMGGLAIVENAYDQTMQMEWFPAARMERQESRLLEVARANMPRLPVTDIDLLIVDRIGKDISGSGIDTKIIGRIRIRGQEEPARPRIKSILGLDLTPMSHGNAIGVGLLDVVTKELADQIDFAATYENANTSNFAERAKLPTVATSHSEALAIGLRFAWLGPDPDSVKSSARVVRIRDTLTLGTVYVSGSLREEVAAAEGSSVGDLGVDLLDGEGRFTELDYGE
jgi:hypothetical protein